MDLYQGLVLGLLAAGVLVLAGIFTRLGHLGRSLEASTVQPAAAPPSEEEGEPAAVAADTGAATETSAEEAAHEREPVSEGAWELVPVAVHDAEPEEAAAEPVAAQEPEPERESEPVAPQEPEAERDAEPVAVQEAEHEAEQVDSEEREEK